MPEEAIGIDVAFNLDRRDLESAMSSMVGDLNRSLGSTVDIADDLVDALQGAVKPLEALLGLTGKLRDDFKAMKDLTENIRSNIASTRMQTGLGAAGGAPSMPGAMGGGGGMLGGIMSLLSGGGLGTAGMGALLLGGGVGAFGAASAGIRSGARAVAGEGRGESGLLGRIFGEDLGGRMRHSLELAGLVESAPAPAGGVAQVSSGARAGAGGSMIQRLLSGENPIEMLMSASGRDIAGAMGGASGFLRSMGQGPLAMFGSTVGGQRGAEAGYDVAGQLGWSGTAGRAVGSFVGGALLPGLTTSYIQQAMSSYPQFLQTSASMAQVGLHGGDVRTMRGLRAARFGYGPAEQGQAFGALFQGYGGGDLTEETQRTAMAYSRAYGVDMGAIGQAMGGLINIGGGGQRATGAERETITARVMSDAIAEGFGRRLPEFAAAVGSGVNIAMSGPSIMRQEDMQRLVETTSRLTSRVMSAQGVGLAGAQRFISPLQAIPGRTLEGMMGGGGDPYQMAMAWATNRDVHGGDPLQFMDMLAEAQADPLGEAAMNMQRGSIEEIMRAGGSEYNQLLAVRQLMPDMSYEGARQLVGQSREYYAQEGTLEGMDMLEAFTGVEQTQMTESETTRETMRDIQRSGENIMQSQLRAMRSSAQFAEAQHGISASMAADAATFYRSQLAFQRAQAPVMQAIGVSSSIAAFGELFGPEQAQVLREGPESTRISRFLRTMMGQLTESDIERMSQSMREMPEAETEFLGASRVTRRNVLQRETSRQKLERMMPQSAERTARSTPLQAGRNNVGRAR